MSRRGKKRGLTEEEQELWERVKAASTPLHPVRKSVETPAAPVKPARSAPAPKPQLPEFTLGQSAKTPPARHILAPSIMDHVAAQPVQMDHKRYHKMKRGKLSPEARIDLHGLTLAAAHPRLNGFIMRSYAEGKRLVLVITGKGKKKDEGGPIPVRDGVLRHEVPHWLSMPPLSQIVLQVVQAHQSHGGGGAYYVYLRRTR